MEVGDGRGGSYSEGGLRRQWRGGTPVAVVVDLGQDGDEPDGEDDGGENVE